MSGFIIAAAQYQTCSGGLDANVLHHIDFVQAAAEQGCNLLIFPELSLTGYDLAQAAQLAITPEDQPLYALRNAAQQYQMTLVVGAPLRQRSAQTLTLGAIIFHPDGSVSRYAKQHLHGQEQAIFSAGAACAPLVIEQQHIGLAICADTNHLSHGVQAAAQGATIYAAGVLVSAGGYEHDSALWQQTAHDNQMLVVIANHAIESGGWQSAGKSVIYAANGEPLVTVPATGEALIFAQAEPQGWRGWQQAL